MYHMQYIGNIRKPSAWKHSLGHILCPIVLTAKYTKDMKTQTMKGFLFKFHKCC